MKGVVLAGGMGTRMGQLTAVTNKHLLAVYAAPMIFYPLKTLISAGIREILIITGRDHMGHMTQTLGSGSEFGAEFSYRVQDEAQGIAQGLLLAKNFTSVDSVAVILGDNLFEDQFKRDVKRFDRGAKIFLKEVEDPLPFGVAEVQAGKVISIEEKPAKPKSNLIVTGFYLYDHHVFELIEQQSFSARGQLEISDTNQAYLKEGLLQHRVLEKHWSDMGTPEALLRSANFIRERIDAGDSSWLPLTRTIRV